MNEPEDKVLTDQLCKLVGNARKIHEEPFQRLKSQLSSKLMRVRPNVGSISLISYDPATPQRGYSGLQSANVVEKRLQKKLKKPDRSTPEKELQSWLIGCAMQGDDRAVKPLSDALGSQYWFVSDELAIKNPSNDPPKLVADLLLVRVDADGLAQIVGVELKYKRATKAYDQVTSFCKLLDNPDLTDLWREFSEIMTECKFKWRQTQGAHGVVVLPSPKGTLRGKLKSDEHVDLVEYQDTEMGYRLLKR